MAKPTAAKIKAAAAAAAAANSKKKTGDNGWTIDPLEEPVFKQGITREYLVTDATATLVKKRSLTNKDLLFLALLAFVGVFVRMYNLSSPDSVVFDEVHFGGFARKYILGTFFMDVHPPLAKMLFASVGAIGGFSGDFEFKSIGDKFPESTPYIFMRQFPALLGVGTVVLCYLTLRQSGVRPIIAFITSFLLIIENSNVTISRYILLDSPLIFFIAAAIYSWKKFEIQVPFTLSWYRALLSTAFALGLALSSKWVGLFTVAWVGFLCVYQMWFIIGDLSVSTKKVWAHFFLRGFTLLGVPIVLYLGFFAVHFHLLSKEGDGGAFMSSAFRAGLEGNKIPTDVVEQVGLGSVVTLRHVDTQGGYLHSHDHFYPTGSKQQQITLYPHLDSNNKWLIEPYNGTIYNDTFVPLINGMKIRLKHVNSGRRLHSHDEKPPVSERDWQKECSCYGYSGFAGDANDDWTVEIVQHRTKDPNAKVFVEALKTIFRLRHAMTGNYLFSSEVKLPDWGFGQQEVTAASQGQRHLTHWYIEQNENNILPDDQKIIINYPELSLWEKVVESHRKMWKINSGLTDHHHWQSDPTEWPFLRRGINYWSKEHKQVYLLGNAVTWWGATAFIFAFGIYTFITGLRWYLGTPLSTNKEVFNFNVQAFSYVLGWGLHYVPFFIMGRQLFLHHYLPALYFGILALGHFLELLTNYLTSRSRLLQQIALTLVGGFTILSTIFYINYSPLIYGAPWTKAGCEVSKPFKSWDYDCNNFHKSLAEYAFPEESAAPVSSAKETVAAEAKRTSSSKKPKNAQQEKHIESPFAENKQASKQEVEQLAPPEPRVDTPKVEEKSENPIVDESEIKLEEAIGQAKDIAKPVLDEVVEPAAEVEEEVAQNVNEAKGEVEEAVDEVEEGEKGEDEEEEGEGEGDEEEEEEEKGEQDKKKVVEEVEEVKEEVKSAAPPKVEVADAHVEALI